MSPIAKRWAGAAALLVAGAGAWWGTRPGRPAQLEVPGVQAVWQGRIVPLDESSRAALQQVVGRTLNSCMAPLPPHTGPWTDVPPPGDWEGALGCPGYVHLRYSEPVGFTVTAGNMPWTATELLMPLECDLPWYATPPRDGVGKVLARLGADLYPPRWDCSEGEMQEARDMVRRAAGEDRAQAN